MTGGWVALLVVVPVAVLFACAWQYDRRHFGPIVAGNARWRRERALRAAGAADREALAALTADDRAWLDAMGWGNPGHITWIETETVGWTGPARMPRRRPSGTEWLPR